MLLSQVLKNYQLCACKNQCWIFFMNDNRILRFTINYFFVAGRSQDVRLGASGQADGRETDWSRQEPPQGHHVSQGHGRTTDTDGVCSLLSCTEKVRREREREGERRGRERRGRGGGGTYRTISAILTTLYHIMSLPTPLPYITWSLQGITEMCLEEAW